VETLTHGRCCFVQLLGYQPLTDGVCDDVLDVVEGIACETLIELMQEENNMRERYDSDKIYVQYKKKDKGIPCINSKKTILIGRFLWDMRSRPKM
jgi:hypothetical protein